MCPVVVHVWLQCRRFLVGLGGCVDVGCVFGFRLVPGCYPGLVLCGPSVTGGLVVGDLNLWVGGGMTVEARDGVTGCPMRWVCPYGTTEWGIGDCGDGGCDFGLSLSPGCYPGLVHMCPSGTG